MCSGADAHFDKTALNFQKHIDFPLLCFFSHFFIDKQQKTRDFQASQKGVWVHVV